MRRALIAFLFVLLVSSAIVYGLVAQQVYDWQEATEEAYFYSLFNTEALLNSGFGMKLEGHEELIARLIGESGYTSENEPQITPLLLPYSSGRPLYVQSASREWEGSPLDQVFRTQDIGKMIITYAAQAKQLERLYQTGIDQNSQTRLGALLRGLIASEAMVHAYSNMRDPVDDLYFASDTDSGPGYEPMNQVIMLWALSELVTLTDGYSFYRGTVSRFESELWADDLFDGILAHIAKNPTWLRLDTANNALFVQALSSYAAIVSSAAQLEKAVELIHTHANTLVDQLAESSHSAATQGRAIRALITALWMTSDESFRAEALSQWDFMQAKWNNSFNLFDLSADGAQPRYEYTSTEIGDVVGAFSALIYGAGMDELQGQFAAFFNTAVKQSRLMHSELDDAGGGFDNDAVPSPENAGGPFGTAPVFAGKVLFDVNSSNPENSEWYVTNTSFETGSAMYLSSQLIWIGQRDRQPYVGPPRFGLPLSREAQFIGLQKQIDRLRESQAQNEDVEGIRTLLQNTENRLEDLSERIDALDEPSTDNAVSQLQVDFAQLSGQLESIEQQIQALDDRIAQVSTAQQAASEATPRGPITFDETVAILIILLLAIIGFVSYQWVVQRSKKDSAP